MAPMTPVIDDLQKKSKHDPLEQGQRVKGGGQGDSLVDQVGMCLGSKLNPGNVVAIISLLSKHNKGKKVVAVKEPASIEKV